LLLEIFKKRQILFKNIQLSCMSTSLRFLHVLDKPIVDDELYTYTCSSSHYQTRLLCTQNAVCMRFIWSLPTIIIHFRQPDFLRVIRLNAR